jgi:type I restriction enzyme S subunit
VTQRGAAHPRRPLWSLLDRRDEFGRPDLPLLTVISEYGVRLRDLSDGRTPSEDLSGYRVVHPGDLVVNKMWARFGAYGVAEQSGIVSPAYWTLVPRTQLCEPRFLHYLLRSAPYRAEIWRRSKDLPPNGFDLPWDQFRTISIPLPPLESQRGVARSLDREMARIDRLLSRHDRLVRVLNERIDASLKEQVGRSALAGGNSADTAPLKRLLQKVERPYSDGAPVVTAYRDGEVNARANRREEGYTLASSEATYQGVRRGDVVLHGLDGFSGAVGTAQVDGCCSPVYHVCEPIEGNDPRYFGRLLRVLALDGYLGAHATSVRERAVDLRNWDLVGAIRVPAPPPDEQRAVAELIDRSVPIADATRRVSALLRERRTATITEAMTDMSTLPDAS